jgi:hypothetical protein
VVQILIGAALVYAASRDFDFNGDDGEQVTTTSASAAARVDRFDADRAWRLLVEQVERFGPRPAGSQASRRLAGRIGELLPRRRFEALPRDIDPSGRLRNVVGIVPGARPPIVVGAHYDTEATPKGHVGANDGAAGTAALIEIARAMRKVKRPPGAPELRFVAFDGEEEPAGCEDFARCGIRGSRAYVRRHGGDEAARAMILLDYIAEKRTRIPREANSDIELWGDLRRSARRVGASRFFPPAIGPSLIDDHMPFVDQGIPSIDLIDFDYPYRDTLEDRPDKLSRVSLDAVGETVVDLLIHWGR